MRSGLYIVLLALAMTVGCSQSGKGGTPKQRGGENSSAEISSAGGNIPQQRPHGSIQGKAVDALIIGGTLSAYSWENGEKGALLGSTITDQTGGYSLSIQTPNKPVLLELVGGHYFEEASGKRVDLSARHKLRSVTYYESGKTLNVMVTPWTNIAVAFAEYQIQTQNLNANNAITSASTALAAIVDVDIFNTFPTDITKDNSETIFSDELKYGITLAALSSLTAWVSNQNGSDIHTTYNSINFAEMMYLDVLADGVLNGNGYRITPDGSISDQIVGYSMGVVPVNVELYRRQLALEMLKVASSDYNKTLMTIENVFSNADRFSTSTHMIWSPEAPIPIDVTGPVIAVNNIVGQVLGGNVSLLINVADLLSVKRVDYYVDGKFIKSINDQKVLNVEINTADYADGEHELHIEAWDSLDNKGETTVPLKFDNSGPSLTVTQDLLTNQDTFTLTGTASDATKSGLTVTVNGQTASMLDGGKWQIDVLLSGEITPISVVAMDGVGNSTEFKTEVLRDKKDPVIEPEFSEARFYSEDLELQISSIDDAQSRAIYFDIKSLSLGGIEPTEENLIENNIPYILIRGDDVGMVKTNQNELSMEYKISRNSEAILSWKRMVPSKDERGYKYIIPFTVEYFSTKFLTTKYSDLISISFKLSDNAMNSSEFNYIFKSYIDYPMLHVNSKYIRSNVTAYEYLSDGNLGGVVGECMTDDLGYCQIAVSGEVDDIQIRAVGGQYLEPATGEKTAINVVKTYVQFDDQDLVVYLNPLSSVYSAMVEREKAVGKGIDIFNSVYGFHPYAIKSERLSDITTLSDGVKLSLQIRGISDYATTLGGSTDEFVTLIAQDYSSDGVLDGIAVLQVDPERLEFYGQSITANTYRTDVSFAALLAVENRAVVYDYLNSLAMDTNAVYGDEVPVPLDIEGPTIEVAAALSWAKTVEIVYQVTDISEITSVSMHLNNIPYAHSTVTSGVFSVDSVGIADGQHIVSIIAVDVVGNTTEWQKTIVVDNTAPVVTLTAPAVTAASFAIAVEISDISAVSDPVLLIDGEAAGQRAVLGDGGFTVNPTNLGDGSHSFTVMATDALGNVGSEEVAVLIDNTAPILKITSLPLVNNLDYKVAGTVADATDVTVTVNGKVASVSEGKWEYLTKLSAFQTVFEVVAVDAVGNKAVDDIKVDYDGSAPSVRFISSPGEYRTEYGTLYKVDSLYNGFSDWMNIPSDLISIGNTPWNSTAIDLAGYMYVEPVITDSITASADLLVETRYLENDVVKRDWEKWTRTSRTIPFVTEVLAPGWENAGEDVIRKLQVRATDKAGNVSEIATWEFKVHIVRDDVAPTIVADRAFTRFSNGDGVLENCIVGELDERNSLNRPICIDARRVSLGKWAAVPELSNDGYLGVEVEVDDPYANGHYTVPKNLLVEYQYIRGTQVVVDWSLAPRQENPKSVYLPLVTEYLGDQFFITDKDTSHKINFRVRDEEGNESQVTFNLRLDVLTPAPDVDFEIDNGDIFSREFESRAQLNGSALDVSYRFENTTSVPIRIKAYEDGNEDGGLVHIWESAQRYNRARIKTQEQWRVRNCDLGLTCFSIASNIGWSDWYDVEAIGGVAETEITPDVTYTEYDDILFNQLSVPVPTPFTPITLDSICARVGLEYCFNFTVGDKNLEYFYSEIEHRYVYSAEYEDGYPNNVISEYRNEIEFSAPFFRVFNKNIESEIIAVGGWFSIPPGAEVEIIKRTILPSVINKDDFRAAENDDRVPFSSPANLDKSLVYSIGTDIVIERAIDVGTTKSVSISKQRIGGGAVQFSVER